MSPDDKAFVAAIHEAGHAVIAAASEFVRLEETIELAERGHGQASARLIKERLEKYFESDGDVDLPADELIDVFLAGAAAERCLVKMGKAAVSEADTKDAASGDYVKAREQLRDMLRDTPEELERRQRELETLMCHPTIWCVIEGFAAVLLERKAIPSDEATVIIANLRTECCAKHGPGPD